MVVLYWLVAFLVFGFLIFIHEMGHYLTARLFGVKIYEFSIGMGPKMITYESKKTGIKYSIGVFLFGGYVSMAGEDEESEDPNAFSKKATWKRLIIVAAGGLINLLFGVILVFSLVVSAPLASNRIAAYPGDDFFAEKGMVSTQESGLRPGDEILFVNGVRVHNATDMSYEIFRSGYKEIPVTVRRGGEEKTFMVTFPTEKATEGQTEITYGMIDFYVEVDESNVGNVLSHTFFRSASTVKMIWDSLFDLITGRYGLDAMSGPVGVAGVISDAAGTSLEQLIYIVAFISINLGVVNLLPLPALDGGRLVFLLIELVCRRPVPRKIEGVIHLAGLLLLLLLMVVISFKDIFKLFG